MALLDLQGMELSATEKGGGHGGGGGSRASLLLCGDSSLSLTTCN
ncbi:SapB/AmfS family lanthipeptide [Micromonospora sp. NPDC049679]